MKQKIRAGFAAVFFLLVTFAFTVNAEDIRIQCGQNVYGTLNELGVLTVSGTGDMWDSAREADSPFWKYRDEIYSVIITDGVTSVGAYNFSRNEKIGSVQFGSTVQSIGKGAFGYTSGLFSVNIPGNVKTIGEQAFFCSNLNQCTLQQGIKTIGVKAFYVTKLTSIEIPEGVSSVEAHAFGINTLKNVTIPKDIGVIKSYAFWDVGAEIHSMDVMIGANAFGNKSVFKAYRNSTADTYAANYKLEINYFPQEMKVTFDANGGSAAQQEKTYLTDTYFGTMPAPARSGYLFDGWYTDPVNGVRIHGDTKVTSTQNLTLYAHWKPVTVKKCAKPAVKSKAAGKLTVTVKKVTGAKGYELRYARKKSMAGAKTVRMSGRTKTLSKLKKKATYYVQARAYRLDSEGNAVYGTWSAKAKVKVKGKRG